MELNLKFDEQLLTKICNKMLDEYEYNGKTIREWADRISNPKTNGDNFRAMTDEELAEFIDAVQTSAYKRGMNKTPITNYPNNYGDWADWLRQEAKDGSV